MFIMLRNKLRHSLYSMTSVVVLFVYRIKLNISTGKRVTKILSKMLYIVILSVVAGREGLETH